MTNIVYGIQAHQDTQYLRDLANGLAKFSRVLLVTDGFDFLHDNKNIISRKSPPITWGGRSLAVGCVQLINWALEEFESWDYFINLSASDAVIIHPQSIVENLEIARQNKIDGFVNFYGEYIHRNLPIYTAKISSQGKAAVETRLGRTKACVSEHAYDLMLQPKMNPISNFAARPMFVCNNLFPDRTFYMRLPDEMEKRSRENYISNHGWVGGRSWYILSRKLADKLVNSKELLTIFSIFGDTICFDEHFLQLWINMDPKFEGNIVRDNKRWKGGGAETIKEENYADIINSACWFARKLDVKFGGSIWELTNKNLSDVAT